MANNADPGKQSNSSGTCQMSIGDLRFTAYEVHRFHSFRQGHIEGGNEYFVQSLRRCETWRTQGGKSNVFFAKTKDDRFVIKQLSKAEKDGFLQFADDYFNHFGFSFGQDMSCLAKLFGLYTVSQFSPFYINAKIPSPSLCCR